MQVGIGQQLYVNVNHNMVYAMANPFKKHGMICSDVNNHGLDHCIIEVSQGAIHQYEIMHLCLHFQGADNFYMKKYGCVIPILTNQPNGKNCNMNKDMTKQFWILLGNLPIVQLAMFPTM